MAMAHPAPSKVIPLDPIDQWRPINNIRSLLFFIVPKLLDENLLRASLDGLIRYHIPILGARIKASGIKGSLEYHLPEPFPDGYSLFRWSKSSVSSTLAATQLLPVVDNPKCIVTWGPSIARLEEAWSPSDWPTERKYEDPDTPLLLVHITSYVDTTVIATNLPHAVSDQMGYASMIEAWLQVARGEDPVQFLQQRQDMLRGGYDLPVQELRKKGHFRLATKHEQFRTLLGLLPELIRQPKEERRLMFLSGPVITRLRDRNNAKLAARYGPDSPLLTNGDVISSILLKLSHLHRKSEKMVFMTAVVNARGRHPSLPAGQPYLHNAFAHSATCIPINRNTPIMEIARKFRLGVTEATDPSYIDRCFAITRAMFYGGHDIYICEPGWTCFAVTNWCRAWHNIDFTPVATNRASGTTGVHDIVGGKEKQQRSAPKAAPLVLGHSLERSVPIMRFNAQIMCNAEGGYWCDFACSTKNMALVETLLKQDPLFETI